MFEFSSGDKNLAVLRNVDAEDQEFCRRADEMLTELPALMDLESRPRWLKSKLYRAEANAAPELVELLRSHWKVWYGQWLFLDWPLTAEAVAEGSRVLREACKDIGLVRATLLTEP